MATATASSSFRRRGGSLSTLSEAVATVATGLGLDGVSELPEAVDVAANGSLGDLEALGELRSRPRRTRLEEAEELQHAPGRVTHAAQDIPISGRILSAFRFTVRA